MFLSWSRITVPLPSFQKMFLVSWCMCLISISDHQVENADILHACSLLPFLRKWTMGYRERWRASILAAGEELYILDVPILMKNTSIFDSQFCDGKMRKRLCRVCWIRKNWQELCATARHWWKRLWNYRHLQPKPDIFHFLVIGGHFMQVNSDYGLKTSERYGSCKGQRRGPKSCVNSRQHHKKKQTTLLRSYARA